MIKPVYDHGGIQIYLGDCRDILPQLPKVDLVLTDPPYGVNLGYEGFEDKKEQLDELKSFIFSLKDRFELVILTPGIRNFFDYPKPNWIMCWHKPGSVGRNDLGGFNSWEPIFVYGKQIIYNDFFYATTGNEVGVGDHPCPKPIKLFQQIIERTMGGASLILDPFMGSGTTLRAAKDLGRKAIGIEIEPKYVEIAIKRLSQEALPLEVPQQMPKKQAETWF